MFIAIQRPTTKKTKNNATDFKKMRVPCKEGRWHYLDDVDLLERLVPQHSVVPEAAEVERGVVAVHDELADRPAHRRP